MKTLGQTIFELSLEHVRSGGLIVGQNLEGPQDLLGTVPVGEPGVIVMPTTETAGCGMAIGMALSGRPVIHILRFASFLAYHAAPLVFFASKAKMLWGYDLPLLVRVSVSENIGVVHSGDYLKFVQGELTVFQPTTPGAYRKAFKFWQETKQPLVVSERRNDYGNV